LGDTTFENWRAEYLRCRRYSESRNIRRGSCCNVCVIRMDDGQTSRVTIEMTHKEQHLLNWDCLLLQVSDPASVPEHANLMSILYFSFNLHTKFMHRFSREYVEYKVNLRVTDGRTGLTPQLPCNLHSICDYIKQNILSITLFKIPFQITGNSSPRYISTVLL
jgi:hypothetical protein